jgi:hypothetical protein
MKIIKVFLVEMILPLLTAWFFMTVLVDIVAIPTVFKNISNMQEGAKIGMTLFGKFNCIEIFLGLSILLGSFLMKEKSKVMITLALILLAFSIIYTFFMTPMIANNSIQLHLVLATDPHYEILQKEHRTFHELYRTLDTIKLVLLLIFSGLMIHFNIKRMHKECI